MLKSIIITDLHTIEQYKDKNKDIEENLWITAIDREDAIKVREIKNYLNNKNIEHHVEYFYDVDDTELKNDSSLLPEWIHNAPNKDHIVRYVEFLKPFVDSDKEYKLGVNCFAGVSRSTALGITAWVMQGLSPEQALENILTVRFCAWPNLRILRFSSEILDIDIFTPVSKWVHENKSKLVMPVNSWKY